MNIQELPQIIQEMQRRIADLEARLAINESKPTYLGYKDAAEFLGLSYNTIKVKVSQGELRPQRYNGRSPLFHREYLERIAQGWAESQAMEYINSNCTEIYTKP
ncbi:MAG: helix-turn-helix domain-containing protein [Phaeodactylibacter sp.]|nr:helix-turn-helix domain-containing protein [Phaeodactylibacter sp.]